MRQAREIVFSTLNEAMACLVVGFAAIPTRLPISEQDARSARSTISSVADLVMKMVLPSPLVMAHGVSEPVV